MVNPKRQDNNNKYATEIKFFEIIIYKRLINI